MNVLFITYDFPYPATSGGKNRAYHLLKYTSDKADVYLYSFVRADYNPDNNEEILRLGVKEIKVFKRRKVSSLLNFPKTVIKNSSIFKTLYFEKRVMDELIQIVKDKKIDIIHFESSYTGYYIGKRLKRYGVKQVLGTENIEFELYSDYAKGLRNTLLKPLIYYQAGRLKKEELEMVRNADTVTTITNKEADTLKDLTGVECSIVANGIEPETFSFKTGNVHNNILFVGNFSYFPNTDAVDFFYKNVFPKLDKRLTWTIIGKRCTQKFKFENPRIIQKDFVEDIVNEYRNADMLVFPIRIGGGTNFKVLEAMSLGVPIVANPERLSGLNALSEEHYLEASTPDEYIGQINRLYDDKTLRLKISKNARRLVEEQFAWKTIGQEMLKAWKKAYEKS